MKVPAAKSGQVIYIDLDEEDVARLAGRKVSIGSHGYAQIWEPSMRRMLLVHRWVMGAVDKTGYRFLVDHVDRNVLDCRRVNLRIVSPSESNMNRVIAQRELPLGVYRTKHGKFAAAFKRNRVTKYLGTYSTVEEAVAAREAALQEGLIRP